MIGWQRTWWFQYRCIASETGSGYNQAALLSMPLAKRLRLPHKAVLLIRTQARLKKQVLSLEERWESVRGVFATHPGSQVDNVRVLPIGPQSLGVLGRGKALLIARLHCPKLPSVQKTYGRAAQK